MNRFLPRGLGWHPDVPDFRDYTPKQDTVKKLLNRLPERSDWVDEPSCVDLREFFLRTSPDQESLNASAAYACAALVEYFEYRAHGRFIDPSALFLFQTSGRLASTQCGSCSGLRTTLKTMVRLGMPSEDHWPEQKRHDDVGPMDPILFSFSEFYRPISYVRVCERERSGFESLGIVKSFLEGGFPVAFGFPVPGSLTFDTDIEFRPTFDSIRGGQAVLAVGYDERKRSLLVRSSWGNNWGDNGCGWLPYSFVEQKLAVDFWTILKPDWLESGEFYRPVSNESCRNPNEEFGK